MLTPRVALASLVLFSMVRFFATPTWPCAVVVLGVLGVGAVVHVLAERRDAATLARVEELARGAQDMVQVLSNSTSMATEDLNNRVGALERNRALGG